MSESGSPSGGVAAPEQIRYGSTRGWWVLAATIGGSSIAFLDSTVVNVALPVLGTELGANVSGLQWVLNGYMLALASLILLAGSLGDRYGRRRVFMIGVAWFAVASVLCAVAQDVGQLVIARVLQGIGGALLTPGSLALIQASFVADDRGKAIGAWSGIGALAGALGPFLGGILIDGIGWRSVFLVNVPLSILVVLIAVRHVPESRDPDSPDTLDVVGAVAGGVGLGGVTYALIEAGNSGLSTAVVAAALVGVVALVAFVLIERGSSHPMLPLDIFASRQFTWANVVTFAVYGGMGAVFFLLVVQLQTVLGYTALQAGVASLPVTDGPAVRAVAPRRRARAADRGSPADDGRSRGRRVGHHAAVAGAGGRELPHRRVSRDRGVRCRAGHRGRAVDHGGARRRRGTSLRCGVRCQQRRRAFRAAACGGGSAGRGRADR